MDSIGQQLKIAREKKRVSLSQAALKTHIKVQHLEALERDDFRKIPAPVYVRGFIRTYCGFLGIDPAPLVREYEEHGGAARPPAPPITSKIITTAPGEEALPTATPAELAAVTGEQPDRDGEAGNATAFNPQVLATAGILIGIILLIVGVIKFWPTHSAEESPTRQTVIEVQRPVERSATSITREPPEPFVDLGSTGGRAP